MQNIIVATRDQNRLKEGGMEASWERWSLGSE